MIQTAIKKIVDKQDLTYEEAYSVMNEIMDGETSAVQNAAFLAALSTKSTKAETIDEISGCAAAMREHAEKVEHNFSVLEIVGTGGDGAPKLQYIDNGSFSNSFRRSQGSKARKQSGFFQMRYRGLP